jgi:hypothetical protein
MFFNSPSYTSPLQYLGLVSGVLLFASGVFFVFFFASAERLLTVEMRNVVNYHICYPRRTLSISFRSKADWFPSCLRALGTTGVSLVNKAISYFSSSNPKMFEPPPMWNGGSRI